MTSRRVAVALSKAWLIAMAALVVFSVYQAKAINTAGGWGWLLVLALAAVATTIVAAAWLVSAAMGLRRGEPDRRKSLVILVVAGAVLWLFRGVPLQVARTVLPRDEPVVIIEDGASRLVAGAVSGASLPDGLRRHFARRNVALRPITRPDGRTRDFRIEGADAGPQCEAVTRFLYFPRGATVGDMKNHLASLNTLSFLNEEAHLAMVQPFGRATTNGRVQCDAASLAASATVRQLVEAFTSYTPTDDER